MPHATTPPHPLLHLHPEVAHALLTHQPVVALESTIISHGMPWPHNVATARQVEAAVRATGAIPATVAVLDGRVTVGLTDAQLDAIAQPGAHVVKTSRRDLPILLARRQTGATTVAGTMIAAALAGIRVFATGGLGGVHRGAETTMDISADLTELAQTPVAVVCAGAKAILDLPLTLEYLETHGVPVLGYQTDEFPAFWSRHSGLPVDARVETPAEIAAILHARWQLGHGGVVVGNPIAVADAMARGLIDAAIERALADAAAAGVTGKAVTPWLLGRVVELTGGDSLRANVALVLANARLAGEIAGELGRRG